jgi:hypothetical protein
MRKEPYTAIYFAFLILLSYVLMMFFVYPIIDELAWIIPTNVLYLTVVILWTISTFRDPGYLQKSEKIEFLTLVERFEPS